MTRDRRLDDETQIMPRVRDDDTVVFSPFVAQVLEASVAQTQAVTNALVDNLTYQEAEARATLELIREAVAELAGRSYVVNPQLFLQALHPSHHAVLERMRYNGYRK